MERILETGTEAVNLVVYREHRYCRDNYFVLMKCEDDVAVCKILLDDLRVMKASLFEIVCLPTRYRIQFSHLINRAMRGIECELSMTMTSSLPTVKRAKESAQ